MGKLKHPMTGLKAFKDLQKAQVAPGILQTRLAQIKLNRMPLAKRGETIAVGKERKGEGNLSQWLLRMVERGIQQLPVITYDSQPARMPREPLSIDSDNPGETLAQPVWIVRLSSTIGIKLQCALVEKAG